jgi:hypothetical protein
MFVQMSFHAVIKSKSMTAQIAFELFFVTLAVLEQRWLGEELLLADLTFELLLLFFQLVEFHVTSMGTC